ncbi:hypothetical protein [Clostridium formicaceticum]|uniref:RNA dependent RNA polymerase n=1 Tax=Clostridium formicaceticum TaxID=1497 RepID=A0AAC9RN89_9CLOT|nr:hypothetical protein [Clostridium formicaceticum]AOY76900.1 hypothetical protein BJL90_14180 [Clostridium formicaceticum]ARE87380.1 hypothetical protein CLFO_17800 [Clostridium formicaceticum]
MKNVRINNINTLAFLTDEERVLYNSLCEKYNELGNIKRYCYQVVFRDTTLSYKEHSKKLEENQYYKKDCTDLTKKKLNKEQKDQYNKLKEEYGFKAILSESDKIKKELNKLIKSRKMKDKCKLSVELNDYRKVYVSSSVLTKSVDAEDIFIVSLHNKHVKTTRIWEQIVKNGFTYTDTDGIEKKAIFYTASTGQIRKKKGFFVVEDSLNTVINKLNSGLTLEKINELGGCNVNKYLAYAALNTSSTEAWDRFDIDKAIVVDDFETEIEIEVDYIDNKTFKITRRKMFVPISHTDGCGLMLPSVSRKNMMIRLPWIKGLLTVANFKKFNEKYGNDTKIKDIYGKWHDIKDIEVIFSKSQFKMYKYYPNEVDGNGNVIKYGWDKYKELFKLHGCTANTTNVEPNKADFKEATLNYQMMQTLTDVEDKEIRDLLKKDLDYINDLYIDSNLQFKELTKRKDATAEILKKYPNFIHDEHVQNELSSRITSKRKELKRAEFHVNSAKYTFIIPDIIAWMQFLFCSGVNPQGVLKKGEVHCSMFKYNEDVDVLRSPHLWKEHCIRTNVEIEEEYREYFKIGNSRQLGVYTSVKDDISKRLMFDVDGDSALVVQDKLYNKIVKRNMKDVVPLYYEMGKAEPEKLSNVAFYKGIKSAFKYNQVGRYSNYMTAEWNTTQDIDTLRVLCSLNNYSIDASKTLYMCYPERDSDIYNKIEEAKNKDMPYFFQYIKDGYSNKELTTEQSTMNKLVWYLEEEFKNANGKRYVENTIEKFNHKEFLNNKSILGKKNLTALKEINYELAYQHYKEIGKMIEESIYTVKDEDDKSLVRSVYTDYKEKIKEYAKEINIQWTEHVDAIIALSYKKNKDSKNKTILLELFKEEILLNLEKNLK